MRFKILAQVSNNEIQNPWSS